MLLVGGGTLLTFDDQMRKIDGGCVAIDGGIIQAVGDTAALRARYPDAEFIDARGRVIMPGLINVHQHIYSAFARGMNLGGPVSDDFLEVLKNLWWRMDKGLDDEAVTYSAYVTLIDGIRNGVTTVFDHHAAPNAPMSLFAIGDVAKKLGLRASLSLEVSDRDGEAVADALIDANAAWLDACRREGGDHLRGLFGLHASFTLSDATLRKCGARIHDGDGYHVHIAEGHLDGADSMKKYGIPVMERMDRFGILRPNTTAVHCIDVDDAGFDLLAARGTFVAHNPQSNLNNAVGTARVLEMQRRGVTVGIGTDGYGNDVLESYRVAPIAQRNLAKNPNVGFMETADMLLRGNAAIGERSFGRPMGALKEGAFGDVIIVDYDPPTPLGDGNQIGHLLFGLTGRQVDTTIVGGRVLMRERRVEVVDAPALFAQAREVAAALWRRL